MRRLLLTLALCQPVGFAEAQGGAQPHNLYSSTRDRADLAIMQRILACGIKAAAEDSNFYEGLAQGFYVVIFEPLPSRAAAEAQLDQARACGVTGQARITGAQRAVSARRKAVASSGVVGISTRRRPVMFCTSSGSRSTLVAAWLSCARMGAGRPRGAISAAQSMPSNPGRPPS
eukprot:gene40254-49050_t